MRRCRPEGCPAAKCSFTACRSRRRSGLPRVTGPNLRPRWPPGSRSSCYVFVYTPLKQVTRGTRESAGRGVAGRLSGGVPPGAIGR